MDNLGPKFLGSMLGCAIGDAIGELAFQFPTRDSLRAKVREIPELVYTDDTAMAIALAESLIEVGDVSPIHLGDTFSRHFAREPWRGYGPGPPRVFSLVRDEEIPYEEAALRLYGGQGSLGNGGAMRVAPLGLFFHSDPDIYRKVELATAVTHGHPLGIDGAAVQAAAVAKAISIDPNNGLSPEAFLSELAGVAREREMRRKLKLVSRCLDKGTEPRQAAQVLGMSIRVDESLPFALYAFLRYPESLEECLMCAALNGGDRDTMGAMAGSISGAYLGAGAIPSEWRRKLENRKELESLAGKLHDAGQ